jgi:hypothetical protein
MTLLERSSLIDAPMEAVSSVELSVTVSTLCLSGESDKRRAAIRGPCGVAPKCLLGAPSRRIGAGTYNNDVARALWGA